MRSTRVAKLIGIAVAAPMLLLANSGSAFADGTGITWTDNATGNCLAWAGVGSDNYVLTTYIPFAKGYCVDDHSHQQWDDSQSNVSAQTGAYWTEKPTGDSSECLASNGQGQAYLEPCTTPEANWNEQWEEVWRGNGFNLVNRWSHWCLDDNASGDVYTLPCNGGQYQLWH